MAGSVGGSGAAVGLTTFPEFERLTTEGSLVNLSVLCPGEGYTEVFKLGGTTRQLEAGQPRLCESYFNNRIRGFASHVVDCVLVA